jgi:hypothetical protein
MTNFESSILNEPGKTRRTGFMRNLKQAPQRIPMAVDLLYHLKLTHKGKRSLRKTAASASALKTFSA